LLAGWKALPLANASRGGYWDHPWVFLEDAREVERVGKAKFFGDLLGRVASLHAIAPPDSSSAAAETDQSGGALDLDRELNVR